MVYCCLDVHEHCCIFALLFAMMMEFRLMLILMNVEVKDAMAVAKTLRVLNPENLNVHWSEYCSIGHQPMRTFHSPCQNAEF